MWRKRVNRKRNVTKKSKKKKKCGEKEFSEKKCGEKEFSEKKCGEKEQLQKIIRNVANRLGWNFWSKRVQFRGDAIWPKMAKFCKQKKMDI